MNNHLEGDSFSSPKMKKKQRRDGIIVGEITIYPSVLYLYYAEWRGDVYLLDTFLQLVSKRPTTSVDAMIPGVTLHHILRHPPTSSSIKAAKQNLDAEFVNAFVENYVSTFRDNMARLLRMGIRPDARFSDLISSKRATIDSLVLLYAEVDRELFLSWLYATLKGNLSGRFMCSRINHLSMVLCWKGIVEWISPIPQAVSDLSNGERRGLMILALARNRPAGENVFAQLPRDLLRLLFYWIQWSLPQNLTTVR
jgi:hypothetical protein